LAHIPADLIVGAEKIGKAGGRADWAFLHGEAVVTGWRTDGCAIS
jgi:hypothetical protein